METPAPGPTTAALSVRMRVAPLLFKHSHHCALGQARFRCKSWRCRRCRRWALARDFARLRTALTARVWPAFYLVLTPPKPGLDEDAWKHSRHALGRLLRRASRRLGRMVWTAVWEQSRKGRLHINLILQGPALTPKGLKALLRRYLVTSGFGRIHYCKPVERKLALAGYLSKSSQLPFSAPQGFQRLRASRGFLPRRLDWRPRVRHAPPASSYARLASREIDEVAVEASKSVPAGTCV
jgi:hypothetical protein